MKYFIKIDEIMKLPVNQREKEAERVIKEVLGEFDARWTDYLTHKDIIKIINNGDELKDKKFSEERKRKIAAALKGKHRSEETKSKISEARKGKLSEETKAKLSESHKGQHKGMH